MNRKLLLVFLAAAALLATAISANTARQGSRQIDVPPVAHLAIDRDRAAERLAGAVRLRTMAYDDRPDASAAEFLKLHAYLERSFPHAHRTLKREIVGGYSLLYTWPGSDAAAKGVMLMAHQDVVPIAPGTEKDWEVDPFAGIVKDGYVWGRGAWDNKGNLLAIFEAIEALAARGFQPRQTNPWLSKPLVQRELEKSKGSNAFTRTTTALTVVHAGNKVNVVPANAQAYVNFRMLPGDTQDDVVRHAVDVIDNAAVKVERSGFASEASRISSTASPAYRLMNRTIREVFPGTVVAPGLMVAATDSRHMLPIADHVFRFSPVRVRDADLSRFHGTNEWLSVANYAEMVAFYERLLAAGAAEAD